MENDSVKSGRSYKALVVLAVIIVVQVLYVCLCFAFERKGVFSDEVWCYGLANSHNKPFIYAPDGFRANYIDEHDLYDNFNEPVSGGELRDYLTVQEGQRFDYASVYHNQTLDCHPVLYYALLHTVCSFFPDTFSLLFAFIPSMIFLCIAQVYLYRLGKLVTRSEVYSLAVCVLYAAVPASLFTFIFLRMYSMLTALLVMNAFYTARFVYEGEVSAKKLLPVLITAFLAFNTQYSAVAFIGFMTFAVCVYLLIKKGLRASAAYGSLMLGTLLLFVAFFPAFYDHIFNNQFTGEKRYGLVTQLRALVGYVTKYTFGLHIGVVRGDSGYYVIAVLVLVTALAAPVLFLLRETAAVKRLFAGVKNGAKTLLDGVKSSSFVPVMLLAGVCGVLVFVDLSCDIAYTLDNSVRYLMPCYPFACLLAVTVVRLAAEHIPYVKRAALPVVILLFGAGAVMANLEDRSLFMYDKFPETVAEAADFFEGSRCAVVIPEKRFIMTNTCAYLYKSDSVWYVTAKELKGNTRPIEESFGQPDYVWIELDNYFLTERQRESLVSRGLLTEEQAERIGLRSELEADTEHELIPDGIRERLLMDEADVFTGSDPDIRMMIEANGRIFYVLECADSPAAA